MLLERSFGPHDDISRSRRDKKMILVGIESAEFRESDDEDKMKEIKGWKRMGRSERS